MTEPHGARVTTTPTMGKMMRPVSNLPKVSEDGEPAATPRVKGVPVEATQTTNPTTGGRQAEPGAGTSGNAPAGPGSSHTLAPSPLSSKWSCSLLPTLQTQLGGGGRDLTSALKGDTVKSPNHSRAGESSSCPAVPGLGSATWDNHRASAGEWAQEEASQQPAPPAPHLQAWEGSRDGSGGCQHSPAAGSPPQAGNSLKPSALLAVTVADEKGQ